MDLIAFALDLLAQHPKGCEQPAFILIRCAEEFRLSQDMYKHCWLRSLSLHINYNINYSLFFIWLLII